MSAGSAVLESKQLMRSFVADVRPECWSGADAALVVADLADLARLVDAASLLFLGRVADCGNWQQAGHARVEEWLAATAGSSEGQAKERLQTARKLEDLPVTERALRDGRLSAAQAGQVASGAAADPSAETGLLHDAQVDSFQTLRRKARRVRAAARPVDTGAIHATRYLRSWTSEDGAFEGRFRLTPDRGAQFLAALERFRRPIFDAARQAGRQEHAECYDADALVELALAADPASDGPRFEVQLHVRVDRRALLRGRTESGETCEIDGIGPVPVELVGHLAGDAVLWAVLTDGDRIMDVRSAGRTISKRLRIAVAERDRCCVVPGCGRTHRLELHHLEPFALGGSTCLSNLARVCSWHHALLTHRGAALTGPWPNWRWTPPPVGPDGEEGGPGPFDDPPPGGSPLWPGSTPDPPGPGDSPPGDVATPAGADPPGDVAMPAGADPPGHAADLHGHDAATLGVPPSGPAAAPAGRARPPAARDRTDARRGSGPPAQATTPPGAGRTLTGPTAPSHPRPAVERNRIGALAIEATSSAPDTG